MSYKTIYCNFFAGPGTGKSTMTAGVFSELKWRGIDCEMVTEYAKDKVWEGATTIFGCQPYIFGKQLFRIHRLNGKVQIVVTDSPILLAPAYDSKKSEIFLQHVVEEFSQYENYNIFLKRLKPYNPNGRFQTLEDAIKKDQEILDLLEKTKTQFVTHEGSKASVLLICDALEELIKAK